MKRSTAALAQPAGSSGGDTGSSGSNAQCFLPTISGAAEVDFGHFAPADTQAARSARTGSGKNFPGGISSDSSSCRIAWMSRLLSASPSTIAGPLSPPLTMASRESRRSPPLAFPGPWHLTHVPASTGRTFNSKKVSASSSAVGAPAQAVEPIGIQSAQDEHRTPDQCLHPPTSHAHEHAKPTNYSNNCPATLSCQRSVGKPQATKGFGRGVLGIF